MLVLEGLHATWRKLPAQLDAPKSRQAGVLLGDTLLCLGGLNEVSEPVTHKRVAFVMRRGYCRCTLLPVLVGCALFPIWQNTDMGKILSALLFDLN